MMQQLQHKSGSFHLFCVFFLNRSLEKKMRISFIVLICISTDSVDEDRWRTLTENGDVVMTVRRNISIALSLKVTDR